MSPASRERSTSSLGKAKLIQLMAYADGELDAAELAALEEELARDPEAVDVVEAFHGLGDRVRHEVFTSPDLTDAIMAHVANAPDSLVVPVRSVAAAEGAKVLDLAAARSRRVKVAAAIGSLFAAAAAVALWIGLPAGAGSLAPELATSALGVQVQHVDSQENVTVFSIPALHSNASSVVVWLGDDHKDEPTSAAAAPSLAAPQPIEPTTADAAPAPKAP